MQTFQEFGLSEELLRAINELGYKTPSPIQQQTLPILMGEPTHFIGLAATGTGKTAAFSLPLLSRIDPKKKGVQALILCPTRELALQVAGQIDLLGRHLKIKALPIYGGASYIPQNHGLEQGVPVVVGTPGRVIDHMKRGTLKLNEIKTLILDEADEMFSMGFKEEIESILETTPKGESNIWLFSATMSKEVRRVIDRFLPNPQQVQVNRTEMLSSTVEQLYYGSRESDKPEILCKLIESAEDFYGLIFCQTKSLVSNLMQYLVERGYKVDSLHGDKDQNSRERTMQAFRDKKVTILICTDVASRGLDVKDVSHVINYSIPRELDLYVHRIGRTARSGKTGIAMSLVTPSHRYLISRIEAMTKSKMKEGVLPTRKDIGKKRIGKILPQFQNQKTHSRVIDLLDDEWKAAIAEMPREEIVGRFISILAADVFEDRAVKPMMFHSGSSSDALDEADEGRSGGRGRRERHRGGRGGGRDRRDFRGRGNRGDAQSKGPKKFHRKGKPSRGQG